MPKEIKTKNTVKDIKLLDKAANLGDHMKNAFIRSKDATLSADRQAEGTQQTAYDNPESYTKGGGESGEISGAGKQSGS